MYDIVCETVHQINKMAILLINLSYVRTKNKEA